MRLKAIVFSFISLLIFVPSMPLFSDDEIEVVQQGELAESIILNEKNEDNRENLKKIEARLESVYGNMYNKLRQGGRLVIHFDPAHGRLPDGRWQGEATNRISSRGLPEEFYSVQFARKFYNKLSGNKFLKVLTNDEYMRVLAGDSDEYRRISFSDTIKLAKSENAFLMISEHLNNISVMQKVDGLVNMPGIHVTCDDAANRYLTYVQGAHEGYLTLYNKYDLSGMSKSIAYKMKKYIPRKGIKLNNWEYGAVADDRFSYFVDFPVSVIFESGFISNPAEEVKLRDPAYQQKIVNAQYDALVESIEKIFGVDVSGFWLKKTADNDEIIDLIKLSRMVIYYLQNDCPEKSVKTINVIENNYGSSYEDLVEPYASLKDRIIRAEKYYEKCVRLRNAGENKTAKANLVKAVRVTGNEQIFSGLTDKYSNYARRHFGVKIIDDSSEIGAEKINVPLVAEKASLSTPVILVIEKDQSLENAVMKALSPDVDKSEKLVQAFCNALIWKKVKTKKYSDKRKRNIVYYRRVKTKVEFREGLYIVKINKNLEVTSAKRVSQILLNPDLYQNHQYLKNSYFAGIKKEKSL